ncbi:MAG: hypothetical protein VXW32_00820 [Myxococcota bacterium]|nr:hypothetical protein [Myxococcota bacterium]
MQQAALSQLPKSLHSKMAQDLVHQFIRDTNEHRGGRLALGHRWRKKDTILIRAMPGVYGSSRRRETVAL